MYAASPGSLDGEMAYWSPMLAGGERMCEEHVDAIRPEASGHGHQQLSHPLRIGQEPTLPGLEQRRSVAEPPLGHERDAGDGGRDRAVPRWQLDDPAALGRSHPRHQMDVDRPQQLAQGLQPEGGVMVAG